MGWVHSGRGPRLGMGGLLISVFWYRSAECLIFALNQRWGSKDGESELLFTLGKWRGKDADVFYFWWWYISEFEKRDGKILNGDISLNKFLVMQNWKISLMACLVLNMCELMKGAQHWEFFHVYIICMCQLRNHLITLIWDAIMASRLLER